ncbi:nitrilase-related carbon-nitrogen hydrolase [Nakamurella endophytica]|uniref:CN hydrolase domain-containing protein n=1 Tax=Nakamurella endophytica TaxID=1748367 RepID=A0A917WHQ3_9ACTN|nr:nitrilase-related carbon-nitrogen hydrolase [Nakamurella endophytica]GGM04873.1 hypothetical protein GCM10011594_26420 [Nakamurella endophytica]
MTRIACCQLTVQPADPAGNGARATAAASAAVAAGAQLVVLPETATSGLPFADRAEALASALRPDDPLLDRWAEVVRGRDAVLVVGFAELGGSDADPAGDRPIFNSAALFDGSGLRGIYRKTHLWDQEKLFFAPGSQPPPVFDTALGRIGVAICYDIEFPELTRSMALAGADVLAVPTAWPVVPHPADEPTPEVVIAKAAARVNRMAIATCDRTGSTRGQDWTGGTVVIGPDGWVAALPGEDDVAVAEVDLTLARDKTLTPLAHLFDDRRPELYAEVAALTRREASGPDEPAGPGVVQPSV